MYNGFSTSGSPGTGLGAILRNSSEFDIYSEKAKGTVVLSKYCPDAAKGSSKVHPLKYGAVCLPAKGEEVCGDGWAVEQTEQRCLILVVDGVGHGIEASEASREAVKLLYKNKTRSPSAIVEAIHAGLISTRGAAVAVAEIDHVNRVVHYCGIGNISGRIVAGDMEKNMVSHNGTAGHNARKIQEFTQPWDDECLLIMHSDGLSARWNLADYPMLLHKHPSIIAGVLYRDFARGMDDATVVAAKKQRG
jgi:hypothetical protein